MEYAVSVHPSDSFRCPLTAECFGPSVKAFPSRAHGNAAVANYRACTCPVDQVSSATTLYLRHMPLVKKVLGRFCRESECHPGGCLPEDLLGDTYPIFKKALDDFDVSYGLDFLGYLSQRLKWGLLKSVQRRRKDLGEGEVVESSDSYCGWEEVEERLLDKVFVTELLGGLGDEEVKLVTLRYGCGFSSRELAEAKGISHGALRKRFERLLARLQSWHEESSPSTA